MMKRTPLIVYLLLLSFMIYEGIRWPGWNWFWLSLLPIAAFQLFLMSLAFISGGDERFIKRFHLPWRFANVVIELGKSFRSDFRSFYHQKEEHS